MNPSERLKADLRLLELEDQLDLHSSIARWIASPLWLFSFVAIILWVAGAVTWPWYVLWVGPLFSAVTIPLHLLLEWPKIKEKRRIEFQIRKAEIAAGKKPSKGT